jgi:hypothetical protein
MVILELKSRNKNLKIFLYYTKAKSEKNEVIKDFTKEFHFEFLDFFKPKNIFSCSFMFFLMILKISLTNSNMKTIANQHKKYNKKLKLFKITLTKLN